MLYLSLVLAHYFHELSAGKLIKAALEITDDIQTIALDNIPHLPNILAVLIQGCDLFIFYPLQFLNLRAQILFELCYSLRGFSFFSFYHTVYFIYLLFYLLFYFVVVMGQTHFRLLCLLYVLFNLTLSVLSLTFLKVGYLFYFATSSSLVKRTLKAIIVYRFLFYNGDCNSTFMIMALFLLIARAALLAEKAMLFLVKVRILRLFRTFVICFRLYSVQRIVESTFNRFLLISIK